MSSFARIEFDVVEDPRIYHVTRAATETRAEPLRVSHGLTLRSGDPGEMTGWALDGFANAPQPSDATRAASDAIARLLAALPDVLAITLIMLRHCQRGEVDAAFLSSLSDTELTDPSIDPTLHRLEAWLGNGRQGPVHTEIHSLILQLHIHRQFLDDVHAVAEEDGRSILLAKALGHGLRILDAGYAASPQTAGAAPLATARPDPVPQAVDDALLSQTNG